MSGSILIVLASPEYLRFFDTTIGALAERGRRVHVVFDDAAGHKPVGLEGAGALPLAGVTVMPPARTFWTDTAYAFRAVVDFTRFMHPDFAHAPALRERIKRKVLPAAFGWLDRINRLPEPVLNAALAVMSWCERSMPVDPRVLRTVRDVAPDLVVVSPLVDAASAQVDWVKAARQLGVPSALAVASWDNLTNKGLMRAQPDRVFVWNEAQRREAVRYHRVLQDRVVATGAPVFDRWFHAEPSCTRAEFCERAGLAGSRPFVLFTGSSPFIARGEEETAFVRRWVAALRASRSPAVSDVAVIVRPHPYNIDAWSHVIVDDGVAVWPRGAFNPADEQGRRDFFDSLYHAAAVVGINTSAMIEAAIVGRPVLTVTDFAATQAGTLHFQYLLPEHGGAVLAAPTLEGHVEQLDEVLRDARGARERARQFVGSFIRPHGIGDDAMPRLVAAVEEAAALPRVPRPPGFELVLRPAMLAFGIWTATVQRLTGPDPMAPVRKSVLHPMRGARKRAMRAVALKRERLSRTRRVTANRLRRAAHDVRGHMRAVPAAWKRCRRAVRQARYAVGVFMKGGASARPRKP